MVMDTAAGHRNSERPGPGVRHRAGVPDGETDEQDIRGDVYLGGVPAGAPRRLPPVRAGRGGGPAECAGAHVPDLHGSRLTPRGRVMVAVVWLIMAAVAALMLATVPSDGSQAPMVTTKVMVEPGETLWQLAGQVQPGADRHGTVAAIMSLNDLDSAAQIRPGDILIVPVEP